MDIDREKTLKDLVESIDASRGSNEDPEDESVFPKQDGHFHSLDSDIILYGPAVIYCYEDQVGRFWAVSRGDEYGSQVNYCPICGAQAPSQL